MPLSSYHPIQLPLWFFPEYNEDAISLCSRTAREIAGFLWQRLPQWENEKLLKDYFKNNWYLSAYTNIDDIPENADLLDIFLTSNSNHGKKYWHRIIGQKINRNWIIWDPYKDKASPIPISKYLQWPNKWTGELIIYHAYTIPKAVS